MMIRPLFRLVLCSALALLAGRAEASTPTSLGKFDHWTAYSVMENGHSVCYMSITAKAPLPKIPSKKVKRGNVVLMITHRAAENSTDVVSYSAGTKFKPATDANFNVGSKSFNLFTQDDTAWSRDAATDHTLTLAIRSHNSMAISGIAATGVPIADTINIDGADKAYLAISKACGVPAEALKKAAPAPKKPEAKTPEKPVAPEKPSKPSVKTNSKKK